MQYKEYNDYELLSYINECSDEANELIYNKYQPIIVAIAKKKIYSCLGSGTELNDLIQEGMLGLNYAIKTFDESKDATFYTYAIRCISNRITSEIVKSNRLKHKVLNESLSFDNDFDLEVCFKDEKNDPEKILINYETNSDLLDKIRKVLTDYENKVFELLLNNFNYKEIAQILDKEPKAIDNAIQRIKAKIKKIVKR